MLTILYLPNGIFLKPKEMFFDPHMRVGHLLLDYGMEDLMKYRKFLCKCYRSDEIYMEREIKVTSIDPKRGLALFSYEDFLPNLERYFKYEDVYKISKVLDIRSVIIQMNEMIEKSEMGMEIGFSKWIETTAPPMYRKSLSRFAFSYHKFYRDNFSNLDEIRKKLPLIVYKLYEIAEIYI